MTRHHVSVPAKLSTTPGSLLSRNLAVNWVTIVAIELEAMNGHICLTMILQRICLRVRHCV